MQHAKHCKDISFSTMLSQNNCSFTLIFFHTNFTKILRYQQELQSCLFIFFKKLCFHRKYSLVKNLFCASSQKLAWNTYKHFFYSNQSSSKIHISIPINFKIYFIKSHCWFNRFLCKLIKSNRWKPNVQLPN